MIRNYNSTSSLSLHLLHKTILGWKQIQIESKLLLNVLEKFTNAKLPYVFCLDLD